VRTQAQDSGLALSAFFDAQTQLTYLLAKGPNSRMVTPIGLSDQPIDPHFLPEVSLPAYRSGR
jgi:hypothetical protein